MCSQSHIHPCNGVKSRMGGWDLMCAFYPFCKGNIDLTEVQILLLCKAGFILNCSTTSIDHLTALSHCLIYLLNSGGRSHWGCKGGTVPPLTAKKLPKIRKKRVKIGKKRGKIGKKRQNREGSFPLPLLTDRAGYATAFETKYLATGGWNHSG